MMRRRESERDLPAPRASKADEAATSTRARDAASIGRGVCDSRQSAQHWRSDTRARAPHCERNGCSGDCTALIPAKAPLYSTPCQHCAAGRKQRWSLLSPEVLLVQSPSLQLSGCRSTAGQLNTPAAPEPRPSTHVAALHSCGVVDSAGARDMRKLGKVRVGFEGQRIRKRTK